MLLLSYKDIIFCLKTETMISTNLWREKPQFSLPMIQKQTCRFLWQFSQLTGILIKVGGGSGSIEKSEKREAAKSDFFIFDTVRFNELYVLVRRHKVKPLKSTMVRFIIPRARLCWMKFPFPRLRTSFILVLLLLLFSFRKNPRNYVLKARGKK